jgi:hypothetical protein
MIDSEKLRTDLSRLLKTLEGDLRERIEATAELKVSCQSEWQAARDAKRTGETYETWIEEIITQAGVHWLLACVFVRFLEDNGLVERPFLSGIGEHLALARDRHEAYFRANPHDSDREYLIACFREVEQLPGMGALFDERHNPLFRIGVSGDAAMALLAFWQKVDPDTGNLVHDFTDSTWSTRFLGDLYQDLSEAARKRYALLQTPIFVEEFILDRTLTPALAEFGYREVRLIDPTCGSGHFLLGAFQRLLDIWARSEPGRNVRDTVQKALDGVYGVDLNPFAVAIARFRLLVAALHACAVRRLNDAPAFKFHLAVGDSLLHGRRFRELDLGGERQAAERHGYAHAYAIEDLDDLNRILGQQYHVVVGNPPYITVKDAVLNQAYRARYATCHMKYSLGVPFTERFFELALAAAEGAQDAGYVGMITTNSFMKREFGSKLIEEYLPRIDLTHVIDTSGAYIPGHGTPTVILFVRSRRPVAQEVRTVMGIKGEPAAPANPAKGLVWRAIVDQIDVVGSESDYVSVADISRSTLSRHPWSIAGGGAAELKELMEDRSTYLLREKCLVIGFGAVLGEDDAYALSESSRQREALTQEVKKTLVIGESVRDWAVNFSMDVLFPYTKNIELVDEILVKRELWRLRAVLASRKDFSKKTYRDAGRAYWEYHQIPIDRNRDPRSICFPAVATHNHFVFDASGKLFNRSAPVIKFPRTLPDETLHQIAGNLNTALLCFWMKQVFFPKGGDQVGDQGARVRKTWWEERFDVDGAKLQEAPLVGQFPFEESQKLCALGEELANLLSNIVGKDAGTVLQIIENARERHIELREQMIALQEDLDWKCYAVYSLTESLYSGSLARLKTGERAFEISLARRMAAGDREPALWFERHRIAPLVSAPSHWPAEYRDLVERRIALLESSSTIGLVERPEYKRRWTFAPWVEQEKKALRNWLLERLEDRRYWAGNPALRSINRLADMARADDEFARVAKMYSESDDFDESALVGNLIASESVPFLPVFRYTDTGIRKREQWERTWDLQRLEDSIDSQIISDLKPEVGEAPERYRARVAAEQRRRKMVEVGDISSPAKYQPKDFAKPEIWRLRGALDLPKERWVSFPGCERGADGSLVVAWAGWDHLQRATALSAYYLDMKDNEGWEAARLQPLLAGLLELVPWLKQWHNEYDAAHATRMGDYFDAFVADEARTQGFTAEDLRNWKPTAVTGRRRRRQAG